LPLKNLFSTLQLLAALTGRQLAPEGAQTFVPSVVPLCAQGAPENIRFAASGSGTLP
jgi:hypothetical protein